MNFWQRIVNLARTQRARPTDGATVYQGTRQAGVHVDEYTALTSGAVWACVAVIADTIAALPWHAFQRTERGSQPLGSNSIDWLISTQPNPEQTAFQFKQAAMAHVLLWGNGYAEVERNVGGYPMSLWPVTPDRVTPDRIDGSLVYRVRNPSAEDRLVPAADMLHFRGLGFDGLVGYTPITMHARAMGISIAADKFAASFYGNGTHPASVLETKQALRPEQVDLLKAQWESMHKGPDKAHKTAILPFDTTYRQIGINPADAKLIEARTFSVREIARIFRVPPHKLADLERSSYSNAEQQAIEFVSDCIVPWVAMLEHEANAKLLGRNQRGNQYTKFNVNALVRGDIKTRMEAYAVARRNGWMSANDIRELEDLNPLPEGQGDDYLVESNLIPLDQLRESWEAKIEQQEAPDPVAQPDATQEDGESSDAAEADAEDTASAPDKPAPENRAAPTTIKEWSDHAVRDWLAKQKSPPILNRG